MSYYVHGDNLYNKGQDKKKYGDKTSAKYLKDIKKAYEVWKKANLEIAGPFKEERDDDYEIINKRVELFNTYKNFIDQKKYAEHFDSRSTLHSSVLEEFMYYLFKDLVFEFSETALIGKSHTFKDIFFRAKDYTQMTSTPNAIVERKDHDFVIGTTINGSLYCKGKSNKEMIDFDIPAVAIECKTYLDKNMLEGVSTAGEQLKSRNPNSIYIVVAERLKLTEAVNLKKYKVDQIYILRKQKNTDRENRYDPSYVANPIYSDVVFHLFNYVRKYLTTDWHGNIIDGLDRGYLIQ